MAVSMSCGQMEARVGDYASACCAGYSRWLSVQVTEEEVVFSSSNGQKKPSWVISIGVTIEQSGRSFVNGLASGYYDRDHGGLDTNKLRYEVLECVKSPDHGGGENGLVEIKKVFERSLTAVVIVSKDKQNSRFQRFSHGALFVIGKNIGSLAQDALGVVERLQNTLKIGIKEILEKILGKSLGSVADFFKQLYDALRGKKNDESQKCQLFENPEKRRDYEQSVVLLRDISNTHAPQGNTLAANRCVEKIDGMYPGFGGKVYYRFWSCAGGKNIRDPDAQWAEHRLLDRDQRSNLRETIGYGYALVVSES